LLFHRAQSLLWTLLYTILPFYQRRLAIVSPALAVPEADTSSCAIDSWTLQWSRLQLIEAYLDTLVGIEE